MRETCRSYRETYKEENMFDCRYCGGEYCWRCKVNHVAECARKKDEASPEPPPRS